MAISLKLPAPPTDEEILEMSERNPGIQFERSTEGELLVTPASSETSQRRVVLLMQLGRWAEAHGEGVVFDSSAGFHLADGSVLSPDAAWMPKQRWRALTPKQRDSFAPLCPDAVFEVASTTDSRRAVEIYAPDVDPQIFEAAQTVALDPVLAGFTLELRQIFD